MVKSKYYVKSTQSEVLSKQAISAMKLAEQQLRNSTSQPSVLPLKSRKKYDTIGS